MAYEVVMPYHLHMPSYFLETFTEYPSIEKQSVTNAVSANSLRFAQIYFFAMCLFYSSEKQNIVSVFIKRGT